MAPPPIVRKRYPRACDNRYPLSHPEVQRDRVQFFKAASLNLLIIVFLFFSLFCYLFGALYQQPTRTDRATIVWVDYDGGIIGQSVRNAYGKLRSSSFPTLYESSPAEFPTESHLWEAVCHVRYWAALFITPGASERLGLAVTGTNADQYDASDALAFIWNEARYPTNMDSLVAQNLRTLAEAARSAYVAINGTSVLPSIPSDNAAAISAFANPWQLRSINIKETTQGTRIVYNTIVIVLVLIQDFFYLGVLNALYAKFKVYSRIPPTHIAVVRYVISVVFTLIGSLLLTTAIWAFRVSWDLSRVQYVLTWLTVWLFSHGNFLTLDVFTIWIPPQFVPLALVTWIVCNVTSVIIPFTLASGFYRWSYAMPSHQVYETLTDVWSNGCNPHLYYSLPILFFYEINGIVWTTIGVYRRCHYAVMADDAAKESMRIRVEAALKLEHDHDEQRRQEAGDSTKEKPDSSSRDGMASAGDGNEAQSLAQVDQARTQAQAALEELDHQIKRLNSEAQRFNTGPSFRLVGDDES
ncbi:hypothetical protein B0I35DRAFT_445988 [Stachybotrys elegans]|uniref:DUF3533 domain-containing protein n=1 Tax=Stachybotrys elegans TaxID=80388 RepID=A0A8K0WJ89_9HYPO|nr:hypothetical protein B0I35DRAFT_445988 [Stachybotrys elegans]